jgi:hypothetical protein
MVLLTYDGSAFFENYGIHELTLLLKRGRELQFHGEPRQEIA